MLKRMQIVQLASTKQGLQKKATYNNMALNLMKYLHQLPELKLFEFLFLLWLKKGGSCIT